MFSRLMKSPNLTKPEKLEFLYLAPYYLQAAFFLVGTLSWLISETVFRAKLPFWTSLWGWSLVLTNTLSLPLVNAVGLFMEEAEEKDYLGLLSFVLLSYLLVPFQAYASLKGFLEKDEGTWFRTPKTGRVTDVLTRGRFYRWVSGLIPVKRKLSLAVSMRALPVLPAAYPKPVYVSVSTNPYLLLRSANNRFDQPLTRVSGHSSIISSFVRRIFDNQTVARRYVFSLVVLILVLTPTIFINYLAFFKPNDSPTGLAKAIPAATANISDNASYSEKALAGNWEENYIPNNNDTASLGVKSALAADNAANGPYQWSSTSTQNNIYLFGKVSHEDGRENRIMPEAKVKTTENWYVSFRAINGQERSEIDMKAQSKIQEKSIEAPLVSGVTARYTAMADRLKADYILADKTVWESGNPLVFAFQHGLDSPNASQSDTLQLTKTEEGEIILDNGGAEIFRLPAPAIQDNSGNTAKGSFTVDQITEKTFKLSINIPSEFLDKANYPITVDPTVLNSGSLAGATYYPGGRSVIRTTSGKLIACYIDANSDVACKASSDSGSTWGSEATIATTVVALGIAADQTSGDTFHLAYIAYQTTASSGDLIYVKSTLSGTTISFSATPQTLDTSDFVRSVSIITDTENDQPAIGWSIWRTSNYWAARFMRCKGGASNCDSALTNWCNGAGSSCGTAAAAGNNPGSADQFDYTAASVMIGVSLEQMPGGGSGTTKNGFYLWWTHAVGQTLRYSYATITPGSPDNTWSWSAAAADPLSYTTSSIANSPLSTISARDETNNKIIYGLFEEAGASDNMQIAEVDDSNNFTGRGVVTSASTIWSGSLSVQGGVIYATYAAFAGNNDLFLKSNSSGTTWSTALTLDNDNTVFMPKIKYNGSDSKLDFIYRTGSSPYAVEYGTFHLSETRAESAYTSAAGLPTDDTITLTAAADYFFDENDYDNTDTKDNSYNDAVTTVNATDYLVMFFKDTNTDNTTNLTPEWEGQFSQACNATQVCTLQIYNRGGGDCVAGWEDVDTDTGTGANTDFTLSGTISTNLSCYYGTDSWIGTNAVAFRVYKKAVTSVMSGKTDYFSQNGALFVPEKVLLLLLFSPLLPLLVKKRSLKHYA
jgi:hypothetical protein